MVSRVGFSYDGKLYSFIKLLEDSDEFLEPLVNQAKSQLKDIASLIKLLIDNKKASSKIQPSRLKLFDGSSKQFCFQNIESE
jgi:hypothetical protein